MPAKRFERELVQGWLHEPAAPSGDGLSITHGASSNCEAPLLKAVAEAFANTGLWVLRFDLPYRQQRRHGPPFPAQAARDREGVECAVEALREIATGRIFLGGSSYGGRQCSMLAAEKPGLVDVLLLLSYPLHAPRKLQQPRTAHFPNLRTPAMFVHGTRDPFGSIEELRDAIRAILAPAKVIAVEGAPHGLPPTAAAGLPALFAEFLNRENSR